MPPAPLPDNEAERLAALRSYEILDSQCEDAFDHLATFAAKLTGTPIALVTLVDSMRGWFKARYGMAATEAPRDVAFCAHAILNPGEPLVVPDAMLDERFADNPLVTGAPDIRFYAGVPLVNPEGFALGTLCVLDREPREFTADQRESLIRLAETVCTTLELRRAMNHVRRFALTDGLTSLANRAAFLDALEKAIARQQRHGDGFALLYLDLDGFKRVNDTLGHAEGDRVLREAADLLRKNLRTEDVAARLGGDEFAALLVGGEMDGVATAERIRTALRAHMDAAGWAVTGSIGVVTFRNSPPTVAAAIAAADALMYDAKAAGKDRVFHCEYQLNTQDTIAA